MSMSASLLDDEDDGNPYRYTTTSISLDDIDEHSHLQSQYITEEEPSYFQELVSEMVNTRKGCINVAIQGDRNKKGTSMLTLHDIGQNHVTCFQSFFCSYQTKPLLKHFTIYHINFPGQEEGAEDLPYNYAFPTMDEMADVVHEVSEYLGLKEVICFGVGAGANVFARLALKVPQVVECLISVNGTCSASTWSDWWQQKMCCHYLKSKGMTMFVQDYLVNYYFGKIDERTNLDLVGIVREQLHRTRSPKNLGLFIESYSKRGSLKMSRPMIGQPNKTSIKCGVLIVTGNRSPVVDQTVNFNSKLDPTNSSWIKISDATSLVLEEQPTGVANALVLFLQGHGYALKEKPPPLPYVQGPEETSTAGSSGKEVLYVNKDYRIFSFLCKKRQQWNDLVRHFKN